MKSLSFDPASEVLGGFALDGSDVPQTALNEARPALQSKRSQRWLVNPASTF